jgi:hypothetical protein
MYSGNHSPCHPLDTLLQAAHLLKSSRQIVFVFVGGGSEYRKIEAQIKDHPCDNIVCLPYQAREELAASLSAADMHVVVMGDPFVGIVHPSKIYNILAIGTPVLYVGPARSHVTDLFQHLHPAPHLYSARHGDAGAVVKHVIAAKSCAADPVPCCDPAIAKPLLLARAMEIVLGECSSETPGKVILGPNPK